MSDAFVVYRDLQHGFSHSRLLEPAQKCDLARGEGKRDREQNSVCKSREGREKEREGRGRKREHEELGDRDDVAPMMIAKLPLPTPFVGG